MLLFYTTQRGKFLVVERVIKGGGGGGGGGDVVNRILLDVINDAK